MSQENVKPDQIQASVAAALSRLRGDLAPPSDAPADMPDAAAPRPDLAQPANDLRAEPGFKPIPAGVTPQASAEPTPAAPEPELPRAMFSRTRFVPPSTPDAPPPTVQRTSGPLARMMNKEAAQAAAPAAAEPMPAQPMTPATEQQPDLLAGLPPPPLSDTLTEDTEAGASRRRRNRRVLVLSVALVAALAALWGWTKIHRASKDVPVIAADSTPEKVKPADEGGLQVPNQNVQVLDNMDSNQPTTAEAETVLPPPEQPVTPPAPTVEETQPAPEAAATETADNSAATVQDVPAIVAPEPPVVEAPAPDTTAADTTTMEQPATDQAAAAPEAPAPEPTTTQEAATPTPVPEPAPAAAEQQPAAATPEPAATQEAAIAPAPAPAAGNSRIQLAAVKSEAAAKEEWAKLQKSYPDLLGGLTLTVQKVDKGAAGIFYRIQAGPLADKGAAKQLCAGLKKRGQDCLVAK